MNNWLFWVLLTIFVLFILVWFIGNSFKFVNKPTPSVDFDEEPTFTTDPNVCEHKEWSSRYDYKSYPGSVAFKESRCLDCGMFERGSGQ